MIFQGKHYKLHFLDKKIGSEKKERKAPGLGEKRMDRNLWVHGDG